VDETHVQGRLARARRLALWERCRRQDGRDLPGPVAAVEAEPEDVEVVAAGRRVDLEVDRLPVVDADVRREPLDRRVAGPLDGPVALGRSRPPVLAHDG